MQCPRLNLTTSVTPRAGRSLGRADMQPAGGGGRYTHNYATTRDGRAHPRMRATHTGAGDRQAQGQDGQTSRPGAGGAPSSHCCRKECGWLAKGTRDGNRRTPMRGMGEVGAEVRRRRKAADGEGERAPLPREVHSPQASRAVGHKSSEGASNQEEDVTHTTTPLHVTGGRTQG